MKGEGGLAGRARLWGFSLGRRQCPGGDRGDRGDRARLWMHRNHRAALSKWVSSVYLNFISIKLLESVNSHTWPSEQNTAELGSPFPEGRGGLGCFELFFPGPCPLRHAGEGEGQGAGWWPTVSMESSTDMRVCRRFRWSMLVNSMWMGFMGPV